MISRGAFVVVLGRVILTEAEEKCFCMYPVRKIKTPLLVLDCGLIININIRHVRLNDN